VGAWRTPVGAYARLQAGRLAITVEALTPDGRERFRRQGEIDAGASEAAAFELGAGLGRQVREEAGDRIVWR
jgi:hydroxymethylbilane synthase